MADETNQNTTETAGAGHTEEKGPIPYSRFAELVALKNALESQVKELKAASLETKANYEQQLAKAQGETSTLQTRLKEMEEATTWGKHEVLLARDGINDPEVIDYLRHRYSSAKPEEGKEKPAFDAWYDGYKATEPAVLRPFLGSKEAGKEGAKQVKKPIDPNAGAGDPGAGSALDARKLASMSDAEYRAQRETLLKQHGRLRIG